MKQRVRLEMEEGRKKVEKTDLPEGRDNGKLEWGMDGRKHHP